MLALPRETDIFLVSYPRSGNTWIRLLLGHLHAYKTDSKQLDLQSIESLVPDLEYGPNRRDFNTHQTPRIFKSHQPFVTNATPPCDVSVGEMDAYACACPNCPTKWRRVIHLVRDGRDAMCSYYHFSRGLGNAGENLTFPDFIKSTLYPGYDWPSHVRSYLDFKVM